MTQQEVDHFPAWLSASRLRRTAVKMKSGQEWIKVAGNYKVGLFCAADSLQYRGYFHAITNLQLRPPHYVENGPGLKTNNHQETFIIKNKQFKHQKRPSTGVGGGENISSKHKYKYNLEEELVVIPGIFVGRCLGWGQILFKYPAT